MKIYLALYCDCTYESSYATLSTHKTKAGAYKAMKAHKEKTYMKWYHNRLMWGKEMNRFAYDFAQAWSLSEEELLD